MNRQQEYLLGMLKELHAICEKHGITYFIQGGTLIGAVRNGGFLPWDDDADIFMTYENWERFKEVCRGDIPENRFLGTADLGESYGHIVPRYVSRDTTSIHACQSLHDDVAGEIIDIFVLDPVADGDEAYAAYLQDMYLYSAVVNYSNASGVRFNLDPRRFQEYMEKVRTQGRLATVAELERNLASHFDENGSRVVLRWQGVPAIYERSWFDEAVPIRFEDTVLMAPKQMNAYLTSYFGEEWTEVPGSVTPSKHDTAASLDFPYTEALAYFRPSVPRDVLLAESEERRLLRFQQAPDENAIADDIAHIQVEIARREVLRDLEGKRAAFDGALAAFDGPRLAQILGHYLTRQTSAAFIGRHATRHMYRYANPLLMDVSDEVFEAGLIALLQTDRIRHATRLLDVRSAAGLPDTRRIVCVRRVIEAFNAAQDRYFCDEPDALREGLAIATSLLEDPYAGRAAEYVRLAAALATRLCLKWDDDDSAAVARGLIARGRDAFPGDGLLAKLEADFLWHGGERDAARDLYLAAAESMRNGLALTDIARKTGYHPSWLRSASWAKAAGIPKWKGDAPKPLAGAKPTPGYPGILGDPRRYLMNLVDELAAACGELDIPYVLGPDMVFSITTQSIPPDSLESYCLVVEPGGLQKLVGELPKRLPKNRKLRYMGNSSAIKDASAEYCGLDSTHLPLKRRLSKFQCLYIRVVAAQPQHYSAKLEGLLDYWRTGKAPGGARSLATRIACRLSNIEAKSKDSGARLFRDCMSEAMEAEELHLVHGGQRRAFDRCLIGERGTCECWGKEYSLPRDAARYLSDYPAKRQRGKFDLPANCICSTTVSAAELKESGIVPADLPSRLDELRVRKKRSNAILRRFNLNYRQMKLAVDLKGQADSLLPRKAEILELDAAGDVAALKKILSGYAKVARKYADVGDLSFDREIYDIMRRLR